MHQSGDGHWHITASISSDWWYNPRRRNRVRGKPPFRGFWNNIHIYDNGTQGSSKDYSMSGLTGAPTKQVTNFPWNTPEQTRQLNTCIRNHRAYAGRFRSRKNAVDFSDEDNRIFQADKAPGGPKIPTKLVDRKQLVPPTNWLHNLSFFQWARDPDWPCPEPIRIVAGVA